MAAGIEIRHKGSCRSRTGGACNCEPSYRAEVWSVRDDKKIRKAFAGKGGLSAAKAWRSEAQTALGRGELRAPTQTTLKEAAEAWLKGAENGSITNRSGDLYKPSAVRGYELALRRRIYGDSAPMPELGNRRLSDIRRTDLQELVDQLRAQGLGASTVQCAVIPLRAIYRRELVRGRIAVNPTRGLELPSLPPGRDRIADPTEAAQLLAAVPDQDRAVWACAMYAGLRRGELKALRANRVDMEAGLIRVEFGWDDKAGEIQTKGKNVRRVPIPGVLREYLAAGILRSGRRDDELLFGLRERAPFDYRRVTDRADKAWKDAGLKRITFHECRHTFASLMIAAGVNAKALSIYMGHANISITLDRYGHLMPGNEEEAAGLLDSYLERNVSLRP